MISEYFQIKSYSESTESDSHKICYLCLPKSQWIAYSKEIIEHDLREIESENE